ncbi:hypothetical protein Prudu_003289, partial [Prunus dulcis]
PCDPSPSRRRPGHHRPTRSPPWVPSGPPPCRRHNLTNLHLRAALSWPENHDFLRRFLRSHRNFQLKILLGIRGPADQQEKPSKGRFSSDHLGDSAEFSTEV